jgi:UDP-4-amino-4,6-dideoxy-N-acetyl-beta-L-altrosamine N-acetyltransferase
MTVEILPIARPIESGDLPTLFRWRNHDSIRSMMLQQHEISWEEHTAWFERVHLDSTRAALMIEEGPIALGYVYLNHATAHTPADWGFYTAPHSPKGTGRKLGVAGLNYAFYKLKVHKVCGQVLAYNQVSVCFHTALGFQQEGVLRSHHKIGTVYHDLICFGLLKSEWQAFTDTSSSRDT